MEFIEQLYKSEIQPGATVYALESTHVSNTPGPDRGRVAGLCAVG
jgi:hypothetical protein